MLDRSDKFATAVTAEHDQKRDDMKIPSRLKANEHGTRYTKLGWNRIDKELVVPVQAELDGQLQNKASHGDEGHDEAIQEDNLESGSCQAMDGGLDKDFQGQHRQVGLVDHGQGHQGKDEGQADGGSSVCVPVVVERVLQGRTVVVDDEEGTGHGAENDEDQLLPVISGVSLPRLVPGQLVLGKDDPEEAEAADQDDVAQFVQELEVRIGPRGHQHFSWNVLHNLSQGA